MKQFTLSRQPTGETTTRFHVLDAANSVIGIITAPNEDADALEKHWIAPAPRAATVGKQQNPMVAAMMAVAGRNTFSKAAVLRG